MKQSNAPTLRELQHWLSRATTEPCGVEEFLSNDVRGKVIPHCISQFESAGVERLSVYAEGYFLRLLEALRHDFSRVHAIVGENQFSEIVAGYLKMHPSRFANMTEVGSHFSHFLSTHVVSGDLPFLADLALFEWLRLSCFTAEDSRALSVENAKLIFRNDSVCSLKLRPSVKLLSTDWSILQDSANIAAHKTFLLFSRNNSFEVQISEMGLPESTLLSQFVLGATLDEAFSRTSDILEGCEVKLSSWFHNWFENSLFLDICAHRN